jgi:hypothetical protein
MVYDSVFMDYHSICTVYKFSKKSKNYLTKNQSFAKTEPDGFLKIAKLSSSFVGFIIPMQAGRLLPCHLSPELWVHLRTPSDIAWWA